MHKPKMELVAPLFRNLKLLPLKNLFILKILRLYFDACEGKNAYMNNRTRNLSNKKKVPSRFQT